MARAALALGLVWPGLTSAQQTAPPEAPEIPDPVQPDAPTEGAPPATETPDAGAAVPTPEPAPPEPIAAPPAATPAAAAPEPVATPPARATELERLPQEPREEPIETWGAIDPGEGFEIAKTNYGNLKISIYALTRYINQLPADQSFVDHLGRERDIDTRQDIQLHRVLLSFMGFIYHPKLNYAATVWTVNATNQVAVVGNLSYRFGKAFHLFAGINGLPGTRSLGGSHPFWLGHDRVMADEFFRPGFTSGVWANGELFPAFYYRVMLGNNLSTLGISAGELTRDLALSGSVWWMPTTSEFGPRGGFGDYEVHRSVATRFGTSFTHHRENRASDLSMSTPDSTQVHLSDSLLLYETDALAPGVTVENANYDMWAIDAGLKYRGFFLQTEYYFRWLTKFDADGPLPVDRIFDHGFYVQGSFMLLPTLLELYGATSWVFGQFGDGHEYLGGANVYPFDTRNMRLNAQLIRIKRSPASSTFGYYVGGQTGVTLALAASVLF